MRDCGYSCGAWALAFGLGLGPCHLNYGGAFRQLGLEGFTALHSHSPANEQPTQNWHDPGESDCLIKTKHCDGRKSVLTQCDFCPVL